MENLRREDFFFFFLLFIEYLLNHSDNVLEYAIYPENTPGWKPRSPCFRWKLMNLTYNPPCHSNDTAPCSSSRFRYGLCSPDLSEISMFFAALYRPSKAGGIFTMTFTISIFDLVK